MKNLKKILITLFTLCMMICCAVNVSADSKIRPRTVKATVSKRTVTVGQEFKLNVKYTPTYA